MDLTNSSLKFPNVSIWFERALSMLESFSIRISYLLLLIEKREYLTFQHACNFVSTNYTFLKC